MNENKQDKHHYLQQPQSPSLTEKPSTQRKNAKHQETEKFPDHHQFHKEHPEL